MSYFWFDNNEQYTISSKSFDRYNSKKICIHLSKEAYLNEMVSSTFMTYDNTPHFLMEFSQNEYLNLGIYCIHVDGITFIKSGQGSKKTLPTFDSVEYGKGVNKYTVEGKHRLNLDQMRRKMVLITMNRSECVKYVSNVHIINTCLQDITVL